MQLHPAVSSSTPRSLYDLSFTELREAMAADGVIAHHVIPLWRAVHGEGTRDLEACAFLPPLQHWVTTSIGDGKRFFLENPEIVEEIHSSDGLTKKDRRAHV